jgi:hypothetical protein
MNVVREEPDQVLARIREEIRPRVVAHQRRRARRERLSKVLHRVAATALLLGWSLSWYLTQGLSTVLACALSVVLTLLIVSVLALNEMAGPEDKGRVVELPKR